MRLLHRTHKTWFANAIPTDGFRLGESAGYLKPVGTYCLPNFDENSTPNQLLPRPALPKRADESLLSGDVQIESNPMASYGADNQNELASVQRTDPYAACSDGEEFDNWADHCCSYAAVSPDNDEMLQDEESRSHRWNEGLSDVRCENVAQLSQIGNFHLSISACFWSWWRSLPSDANPDRNKPYLKARKFVHLPAQWVNVPRHVIEDLIRQSQGAVLSNLDGLIISNGSVSLPRACIQAMFEVIDDCLTGTPYLPSDSTDNQVRGLGSMVAFWERMRNICPKANVYNGPIHQSDGSQCVTSSDLDRAMLATRDFWFEEPVASNSEWDCILDLYENTQEWPDIELPNKQMLLDTLLHTKDSAPGPDGLPYAAWRLLPEVTVDAMLSYFYDILAETALPPLQVGVWIPKAKMGPEADNFRPLGMPNTLERLVDGTAAAQVMRATASNMHPSQTVMSMFKEPQRAVTGIQNLLDSDKATCSLLADLSKAFERVNPHWILRLLRIKRAPR